MNFPQPERAEVPPFWVSAGFDVEARLLAEVVPDSGGPAFSTIAGAWMLVKWGVQLAEKLDQATCSRLPRLRRVEDGEEGGQAT